MKGGYEMNPIDEFKEAAPSPNEAIRGILKAMSSRFIGHEEVLKVTLGAYLVGGHILIEDMPGLGKTTLAKTLASHVAGIFTRVQFTPDLMPSDILGVSIYNPENKRFEYNHGPIFTNIFMADEINRSSPKTQSSLLEAMEERQVTAEGTSWQLPSPFMVIATQNPIEFEGTFPLPEAQLDRFLVSVHLGYARGKDEMDIYRKEILGVSKTALHTEMAFDYQSISEAIGLVHISDAMYQYAYAIVEYTREHESLYYGLSPRAGIGILKLAKYWAFLDQRDYVVPEDVKKAAPYVMGHRLMLRPEAKYKGESIKGIIESVLSGVGVPKGAI